MPTCCIPTQIDFAFATSTSIPYDQTMKDKYGSQPRVFVYYYDEISGEFYISPFFTLMKFDGNTITVDHGGSMSGFVIVK